MDVVEKKNKKNVAHAEVSEKFLNVNVRGQAYRNDEKKCNKINSQVCR